MNQPKSHTYAIGLPVIVTVSDSGTVHYEIDTSEASKALVDGFYDGHFSEEVNEVDIFRDAGHIELDHDRRRRDGLS